MRAQGREDDECSVNPTSRLCASQWLKTIMTRSGEGETTMMKQEEIESAQREQIYQQRAAHLMQQQQQDGNQQSQQQNHLQQPQSQQQTPQPPHYEQQQQQGGDSNKPKRHPFCSRCRNHGKSAAVKGHKRHCEYRDCQCEGCKLVECRQIVSAAQIKRRRYQKQDEECGRRIEISPPVLAREPAIDRDPAALIAKTLNGSKSSMKRSALDFDLDTANQHHQSLLASASKRLCSSSSMVAGHLSHQAAQQQQQQQQLSHLNHNLNHSHPQPQQHPLGSTHYSQQPQHPQVIASSTSSSASHLPGRHSATTSSSQQQQQQPHLSALPSISTSAGAAISGHSLVAGATRGPPLVPSVATVAHPSLTSPGSSNSSSLHHHHHHQQIQRAAAAAAATSDDSASALNQALHLFHQFPNSMLSAAVASMSHPASSAAATTTGALCALNPVGVSFQHQQRPHGQSHGASGHAAASSVFAARSSSSSSTSPPLPSLRDQINLVEEIHDTCGPLAIYAWFRAEQFDLQKIRDLIELARVPFDDLLQITGHSPLDLTSPIVDV